MAINAQNFIYSAKDFVVVLTLSNGASFPLLTLKGFTSDISVDDEEIFAIGQEKAIAIQRKNKKVVGTFDIQAGELNNVLVSQGIVDATDIKQAIITVVGAKTDNPLPFARTFSYVTINKESFSIKAGDPDSIVPISFKALTVK